MTRASRWSGWTAHWASARWPAPARRRSTSPWARPESRSRWRRWPGPAPCVCGWSPPSPIRLAARSIGIAPEAQSALAFAVSAAFAALAGVLLALVVGFVSPDPFSLALAISLIAACVLGGAGTVLGAVVGGAYLTWAPAAAESVGVAQPILQGVVLIARAAVPAGRSGALPRTDGTPAPAAFRAAAPRRRWSRAGEPRGPCSAPAATAPELLRLDEVAVTFGGLKALEGASMSVRAGETLAIIGPNGAGKTTLLNVLSGLVGGGRVAGSVRYAGKPLLQDPCHRPPPARYRAHVPARGDVRRADRHGERALHPPPDHRAPPGQSRRTAGHHRPRARRGPLPGRAAVRPAQAPGPGQGARRGAGTAHPGRAVRRSRRRRAHPARAARSYGSRSAARPW